MIHNGVVLLLCAWFSSNEGYHTMSAILSTLAFYCFAFEALIMSKFSKMAVSFYVTTGLYVTFRTYMIFDGGVV